MYAVSAKGLTKSYDGKTNALNDLNLDIPQGSVYGFLGPNGAGKTTSVKLFTGLLKPTQGECTVLDLNPVKAPGDVHRLCGVMTESARMYGQLTGTQNLLFFAQTAGLSRDEGNERAVQLLKELDLWDAREKKLSEYSTGMAQRLSLARALINRPQVLFLDEPTSGLDPESAQTVNSMITDLAGNTGTTVFLCTHQLRYAQDICDSYGIVDKGRLIAGGSLEALCSEIGCRVKAAFRLPEGDSLDGFDADGGWWRTELEREDQMPKLLKTVVESGHNVFEARLVKPTLEDIYFEYLKRQEEAQ
ncbi:ABC transporter ATP-binding protein [Caproiciproducens sp. CPB-2]|uniref:ABC transporter ATP-binding protein n=1 Tax=Caproiciproducens sp. CPB-2 TaxID=3030017 RepID=UPI0023D9D6CA|nr:ABC transporter ATP-binding protein [Caproiciproducens sp. CPB-2]MDF1496008.1 ABC transporter ATP-binding protein [Caproiciproducens sp. CPB-2]